MSFLKDMLGSNEAFKAVASYNKRYIPYQTIGDNVTIFRCNDFQDHIVYDFSKLDAVDQYDWFYHCSHAWVIIDKELVQIKGKKDRPILLDDHQSSNYFELNKLISLLDVKLCKRCDVYKSSKQVASFWHLNNWKNEHGVEFTGTYCSKCYDKLHKQRK